MNPSDKCMLVKAQRLSDHFTRPEPPEILRQGIERETLAAWDWAEAGNQYDLLAGLAWATSVLLTHTPSVHYDLRRTFLLGMDKGGITRARFLVALAELDIDPAQKLNRYEEALSLFTQHGAWAAEAGCASLAGDACLGRRELARAQRYYLHSFTIWSDHKHFNGIGLALINLAHLLEMEKRYLDACRLYHQARKQLYNRSIWTIHARDTMNRILHEQSIPTDTVSQDQTAEQLVAEIFAG
ncbi:MAG: hypothetical protein JW726_04150 [Anaerolineales bacterium]|nr:hypothetical protein [Anaerolineales bacterium]